MRPNPAQTNRIHASRWVLQMGGGWSLNRGWGWKQSRTHEGDCCGVTEEVREGVEPRERRQASRGRTGVLELLSRGPLRRPIPSLIWERNPMRGSLTPSPSHQGLDTSHPSLSGTKPVARSRDNPAAGDEGEAPLGDCDLAGGATGHEGRAYGGNAMPRSSRLFHGMETSDNKNDGRGNRASGGLKMLEKNHWSKNPMQYIGEKILVVSPPPPYGIDPKNPLWGGRTFPIKRDYDYIAVK